MAGAHLAAQERLDLEEWVAKDSTAAEVVDAEGKMGAMEQTLVRWAAMSSEQLRAELVWVARVHALAAPGAVADSWEERASLLRAVLLARARGREAVRAAAALSRAEAGEDPEAR